MRLKIALGVLGLILVLQPKVTNAMFSDDPVLTKVMSEFEYLKEDGKGVLEWDVDAWRGKDLAKYWLKTSGEFIGGKVEHANIELVYSRAVSAYWDQQFGFRRDFDSGSNSEPRSWLSVGYLGTAPYFIEVDARFFVGEESSSQLLIELEKELMLTQSWVITPELDIVANGNTNPQYDEGSGLADIEFSLRLGYEHNGNKKFQPFIGVSMSQSFGATKNIRRSKGESTSEVEFILGIHSWF